MLECLVGRFCSGRTGRRPWQGKEGGRTGSKFKFQLYMLSDLGEGSA